MGIPENLHTTLRHNIKIWDQLVNIPTVNFNEAYGLMFLLKCW